jgi:atypical dual specificity phosphatase
MNPFHYLFDKAFPVIRFVYEKIQRHRWFDKIADGLWLGGAPHYRRDYDFLSKAGIDAVVNIRAERDDDVEYYRRNGIDYLQLKVLDILVPPPEILDEGVAYIHQQIEAGKTVLVHCAKGRGRSNTLPAAYLMRHREMSFEEAADLIKDVRPLSNLQARHKRALESWLQRSPYEGTGVSQEVEVAPS